MEKEENGIETKSSFLKQKTAAFEQAAAHAMDPERMASKISSKSDRKKYDFATGLQHDLIHTRAALRDCSVENKCTFGALFAHTEGQIANLNRVLQNLKEADEISFEPECFFAGMHNDEVIRLLDKFWGGEYNVDEKNVFRDQNSADILPPRSERKGRSYIVEDLCTSGVHNCAACGGNVRDQDRMTVRAQVYHLKCITCSVCGSGLQHKADYITFDGQICCSSDCIRRYDGAHVKQARS